MERSEANTIEQRGKRTKDDAERRGSLKWAQTARAA